jgi:hypothetical protein
VTPLTLSSPTKATPFRIILWRCLAGSAEFVSGYTGARLPALTLPLLKNLVQRAEREGTLEEVIGTVRAAIARLVRYALQDEDESLWDLGSLLAGLAEWIRTPGKGENPQVPIHLFLYAIEGLPLLGTRTGDRLSLAGLLASGGARGATVQALSVALQRPAMRDRVRDIINEWIEERRRHQGPPDPLQDLALALAADASTPRDQARIAYFFRPAAGVDLRPRPQQA